MTTFDLESSIFSFLSFESSEVFFFLKMFQDDWNASSSDGNHGSEWVIRTSGSASPVEAARYLCSIASDASLHPACTPNRANLVIIACVNPSRNSWLVYVSWNKDTILDIVRQWWECFDVAHLTIEDISRGEMSDVLHSPCRIPGTIQFFDATFRLELSEDLSFHCFCHQRVCETTPSAAIRMLLCVCEECPIDDLKALQGGVSFAVVARHRRSVGKAISRWYFYTELIATDNDEKGVLMTASPKVLFPHCASHLVEIDRALTAPELQPLKVAFVLRSDSRERGTVTIIDGSEEIALREVCF